jgi:hypothetical protein
MHRRPLTMHAYFSQCTADLSGSDTPHHIANIEIPFCWLMTSQVLLATQMVAVHSNHELCHRTDAATGTVGNANGGGSAGDSFDIGSGGSAKLRTLLNPTGMCSIPAGVPNLPAGIRVTHEMEQLRVRCSSLSISQHPLATHAMEQLRVRCSSLSISQHPLATHAMEQLRVRSAFVNRILLSRMLLVPTPAGLKQASV